MLKLKPIAKITTARAVSHRTRVIASIGSALGGGLAALLLSSGHPAQALPSYAAQTGQPCTSCHVGGFGPQLTPTGRAFKIGGYTQGGGEGWRAQIPFSVQAFGSLTHTDTDQPSNSIPGYGNNNNVALDQVSGFIAGGFGEHSGTFVQITSNNNGDTIHLDNTDLRPYTTLLNVGEKDLRVGLTVNNSPTVQDPYNTTFAWGYPFVSSFLAPAPAAQPVLAGAFSGNTIGATAYAWYDNGFYLEAGGYNTMSRYLLGRTGDNLVVGGTAGTAPYVRAAYELDWNNQAAHVGVIYLETGVNPLTGPRDVAAPFGHDHYADYAFDASYQYLGTGEHIAMIQGIYTHEDQNLVGTAANFNNANGTAFGSKYSLDQIRVNTSYWYQNTYGGTFAWQRTWGSTNPVLFAPNPVTGSNNSKPDSNAFILEADWVPFGKADSWAAPFANLKLGAQYVIYTKFNGGDTNYDGFGRNAGDNNTLYLFAWIAF
jgi:hypothetical protein